MHFRVHAAYRTATRQCTEVSKEDEHHWDWTSTVKRSGEDSGERSRRQQAPSAPIQRRRRLIAATERSRNQADRQQEKQSQQQAPSCRRLRAPAASGIFLRGSAIRQQ